LLAQRVAFAGEDVAAEKKPRQQCQAETSSEGVKQIRQADSSRHALFRMTGE
jgi:hypothetical protein